MTLFHFVSKTVTRNFSDVHKHKDGRVVSAPISFKKSHSNHTLDV